MCIVHPWKFCHKKNMTTKDELERTEYMVPTTNSVTGPYHLIGSDIIKSGHGVPSQQKKP